MAKTVWFDCSLPYSHSSSSIFSIYVHACLYVFDEVCFLKKFVHLRYFIRTHRIKREHDLQIESFKMRERERENSWRMCLAKNDICMYVVCKEI